MIKKRNQKDNNMKSRTKKNQTAKRLTFLIVFAAAVLAVLLSGCGQNKNQMATNKQNPSLLGGSETSAAPQRKDAYFDEDFDMFEQEFSRKEPNIADPLEPVNRLMFNLNDVLYFWVAKPCAETCKKVVPSPVRLGIRNFFQNVTTPVRYVNCLLQGKGHEAGNELDRFLINTTEGVLGFGDPAKDKYGKVPAQEDLGQTLAGLGLDNGFYLVWPVLGPSTLRDSAGKVGDIFLNPVFYVQPSDTRLGIGIGKRVNESTFHIGEYESIKNSALDPYIVIREAYIQYRNKKIQE